MNLMHSHRPDAHLFIFHFHAELWGSCHATHPRANMLDLAGECTVLRRRLHSIEQLLLLLHIL